MGLLNWLLKPSPAVEFHFSLLKEAERHEKDCEWMEQHQEIYDHAKETNDTELLDVLKRKCVEHNYKTEDELSSKYWFI